MRVATVKDLSSSEGGNEMRIVSAVKRVQVLVQVCTASSASGPEDVDKRRG